MGIGGDIINTTNSVQNAENDFKNFTAFNNLFIIFASAICVGMATRDMISDIMNKTILPLLLYLTEHNIYHSIYIKIVHNTKLYPTLNVILIKFGELIWIFIVWFIILLLTYIIFRKVIKVDLVTSKVNIIQNITRYITGEEKKKNN